ncbi:MAG: YfhO family protein [Anaerostipes sp.]|nr:YfhO family protein [Anaerostipes sp.]
MQKIKQFCKRHDTLLLGFLIPFCFMEILAVALEVQPFGNKSFLIVDALHQYLPFFADYWEKLRSMDSLFYSFHGGLGHNFLGLWAYYLSSPLNVIVAFFPKTMLNEVLSHLFIFKIALCGCAGTFYFKRRNKKYKITNITFGFAYALSSYIVGYSWNIMWLEVMILLPVILVGVDRLIKERDGRLYCVALFFSLFCNFYMSFMTCLFLVFWYILYDHKNVKEFFARGIQFAFYSLLSAGMAAVVLIPAYVGIMKTSSAKWDFPKELWYGNFANLYSRHFIGTEPWTNSVFDGDANLYCGIFTLILVVAFFIVKGISWKHKLRRGILLAFLFFSFNMPIVGYVWHGFHNQYGIPNRFSYLYIFLLLTMAHEGLLAAFSKKRRQSWKLCVAAGMICVGIGAVLKFYQGKISMNIIWMTVGVVLVYYVLFMLYQLRIINLRLCIMLCCVGFFVEIAAMAGYGFVKNGQVDVNYYFSDTGAISKIKKKTGTSIAKRMEITKGLMLDESIWHTLNGVTLFGSTASGNVVDTMDDLGFYTGVNEYLYEGATPLTNNLFSVQYNLIRPEDTINTEFQYKSTEDTVKVFENEYKTSIGYGMSSNIFQWIYEDVDPFYVQNNFIQNAYGIEGIFKEFDTSPPKAKECTFYQSNDGEYVFEKTASVADNLTFNIPVKKDGKIYLHFDGSQVESTLIYKNDDLYTSGRLNAQCIYIGDMKKGDVISIEMQLDNDSTKSGVVRLKAAYFDEAVFQKVYQRMQEESFQIKSESSTKITGTINKKTEGTVFFSIPDDQGWSAYVDGKKVKTKTLAKAFLCVDVTKGEHTITLEYVPPGFKLGAIISAVSILLFAGILLLDYKKKIRKK